MDVEQQHQQARQEAFAYRCHACSRCCQHKIIQVNPYEVARLARSTGKTVAQFRSECTEDGQGAILRRTADSDTCIFLGEKGCTVHPDRPLVCRLYPLGRRVAADGNETWLRVEPHPQTAGEYSKDGTIADYIAAQGALPFMRAADAYAQWVRDTVAWLETADDSAAGFGADPVDMDAAIAAHCTAHAIPEPSDMEDRRRLHIQILYQHLTPMGDNDGKDISR